VASKSSRRKRHTRRLVPDNAKAFDAKTIDKRSFDLTVKNPNGGEEVKHSSPQKIMDEIASLDAESAEMLANIKALL